jgi:excisionase family DNA binding protein
MERLDWPQIASPRVDEFLTVKEVTELLKLNRQTVRNWLRCGELAAIHVGRRVSP